ncbi:MAG: hypothetical protein AAFN79_07810 [Pseudomonadota bacterium]
MKTNHILAAGLAAAVAASAATQANAQAASEIDALRAEQSAVFQEMFAAPDNVDLMLEYALISVRLKDYEAAITTLERILIYRPDFPRVKLELGASYFRIGSYPVARFYFDEVASDPDAGADLQAKSAEFIEEIDRRTQTTLVTGKVGVALQYTTNANNGPDSADFLLNDLVFRSTTPGIGDQDDVGVTLTGQLSIINDLGTATGDEWRTDFVALSTSYFDVSEGNIAAIVARTGPRLSVDDDRFGVKVRPYVELDHVRYGNDPLQSTIGVGAEVTNTIDQTMAVYGDAKIFYRDHHEPTLAPAFFPTDLDGLNFRAKAGLNYFYSDELVLTGELRGDYEAVSGSNNDASDSFEIGLRGIARFFYDSEMDFASRRWMLQGEIAANYRDFASPSVGNSNSRDDVEFRVGLTNTAYLWDGWSLVSKASYFIRDSNYPQFDLDSFTISMGAEFQF